MISYLWYFNFSIKLIHISIRKIIICDKKEGRKEAKRWGIEPSGRTNISVRDIFYLNKRHNKGRFIYSSAYFWLYEAFRYGAEKSYFFLVVKSL